MECKIQKCGENAEFWTWFISDTESVQSLGLSKISIWKLYGEKDLVNS